MTTISDTKKIGERLPSQDERNAAKRLRDILASNKKPNEHTCLEITDLSSETESVALPPALLQLITELLDHVCNGDAVKLLPVNQILTINQAADILSVSRPHFRTLLKTGVIQYETIDRHRCIRAKDVFEYQEHRNAKRALALDALADLDRNLV